MKNQTKKILVATFILFTNTWAFSQTVSEIYNLKEITWFGLDFTKAKFVGDFGKPENTGAIIKEANFRSWNDLMINEAEKFDLKKKFKKEKVYYKFDKVNSFNDAVNPDSIKLNADVNVPPLSIPIIKDIAAKYANPSSTGVGVVFVIEVFNKVKNIGVVDVVFFNNSNGEVLLCQRTKHQPGGFGVRNYWAKTIYGTIQEVGYSWDKWIRASKKKQN